MESSHLGWRVLARRQWPLAGALLLFVVTEKLGDGSWWQLPGTLVVSALAVLAPRRPFDAALAAATAVLVTSVLIRLVDEPPTGSFVDGLALSETAAVMAIIAVVVRQATAVKALVGTAVLVGTGVVAQWVRPSFWDKYGAELDFRGPTLVQQVVVAAVLLVLSLGTGLYFRARDRERATLVRSEVTAAQHAERIALARELHDVVAHYVTAIVVHAQAAQAVPAAAQEVLPIIAQSGNEALTAMRRLVGTLREAEDGAGTGAPAATSDLADDVRKVVAQSGQPVRLSLDLPSDVPPSLARSVLRLVQESLTNARKHAEGVSAVDVSVAVVADAVLVVVSDDGRAPKAAPVGGSGGFGLVGMRERVELLGGTFTAGRRDTGGWQVRAELPLAETR
ncbi:histidine kinase [Actinosynnema sp. NPDC047251]|uniref:histidine kinase n=1 Tax=Saccharothrix espanaensis (strain ATCC 51144 / DSM 44229 / JCM 9112 / NBRC 15066 / NRRL 15764) TaxID=1179773 RepID=K0KGL1_SACES|nr:histidine kinase [Saccharothrix espanaensis]CCH35653.1 putative histidine kinase [Saccharothrix espanaensis DSM 44229]